MQRAFLIGGVLIALIALGVVLYLFIFAPQEGPIVADPVTDPFGTAGDYEGGGATGGPVGDTGAQGEEVAPRLFRITAEPVAEGFLARAITASVALPEGPTEGEGIEVGPSSVEQSTVEVRYIERASGNVYAYDTEERTVTRISNRTLPGIIEAVWTKDGSFAFLRFLSEEGDGTLAAETYALPVDRPEEGYLLEQGLDSVIVSGTSTVVTLLPNSSGSIATAATAEGGTPRTVFTSLLSSLRLLPAGSNFFAYTKASSELEGSGFLIDGKTGAFERTFGPFKSLTALPSPTGAKVLFSYVSANDLKAFVMDLTTRESVAIPVDALPEKCVWAADESTIYCAVPRTLGREWPDLWYQGATSFSDRMWKVDLEARAASLLFDPATVADIAVDGVGLAVDQNADYLVFKNKKDGSLWAYDL